MRFSTFSWREAFLHTGISEMCLSNLSSIKQCIKVENVCSNFKYIYKGDPQGSILGPVLLKKFML
jgi:hypothetical protein